MRVCAVVVTYNRKKLLIECLEALRRQTRPLDAIYIIDNASTDGTPQLLQEQGYIKTQESEMTKIENLHDGRLIKVVYVRMKENVGGAGGFHEGVKRAFHDRYDWIWLMDDDAEPLPDTLKKLLHQALDHVSAVCSTVLDKSNNILLNHRGHANLENIFPLIQEPIKEDLYSKKSSVEIDTASFVGILINRKKIERIGFPKKEFFIHHDDIEYCMRLRNEGKIILVTDSIILHKEASKKLIKKKFQGKTRHIVPFENLWLNYYGIRNLTYLGTIYSKRKVKFYVSLFRNFVLMVGGILLLSDNKYKRLKFLINAYLDGLRGRFDNEKPRRILYG
ncbi:family 2 glycosyl transferase [Methanothermobacter thermautotrophicus]|uniref:Family 2 glycosyl transferase n=1 Tax=Methanothermobacter thermautotrophicus TaxID=145262 RepID=A0A842YNG3_METTF|nr:glycosyltransferase family 2 protein [Methanothermobacter thermautotrophicus]MBE2899513.1 family 2 glycosyl transferase [Methanothermobacter thermautotrophicus]MCQ8905641.1 glycosyltransferase family 2 protein [Methanothermobacter sp.]